jgi:hypothetical protein
MDAGLTNGAESSYDLDAGTRFGHRGSLDDEFLV